MLVTEVNNIIHPWHSDTGTKKPIRRRRTGKPQMMFEHRYTKQLLIVTESEQLKKKERERMH